MNRNDTIVTNGCMSPLINDVTNRKYTTFIEKREPFLES